MSEPVNGRRSAKSYIGLKLVATAMLMATSIATSSDFSVTLHIRLVIFFKYSKKRSSF
jgi:hypothetical protein